MYYIQNIHDLKDTKKHLKEISFEYYINKKYNSKTIKIFHIIICAIVCIPIFLLMLAPAFIVLVPKVGIAAIVLSIICILTFLSYLYIKKCIIKNLFNMEVDEKKIQKIYIKKEEELNYFLEKYSFCLKINEPLDSEIFNYIYIYLYNINALKNSNLKIYIIKGKLLNIKYNWNINDDVNVICVYADDIIVNDYFK